MYLLATLAGCLVGYDVDRLGSPDFQTRELAESRLALWGVFARPQLENAAALSPDPEIRSRSGRILRRVGVVGWLVRLPHVWAGDAPESYWDTGTRKFVTAVIKSLKVDDCWPGGHRDEWAEDSPWRIDPAHDHYTKWRSGVPLSIGDKCNAAMRRVRTELALRPGVSP